MKSCKIVQNFKSFGDPILFRTSNTPGPICRKEPEDRNLPETCTAKDCSARAVQGMPWQKTHLHDLAVFFLHIWYPLSIRKGQRNPQSFPNSKASTCISCEISLLNLALRKELRETQLQLPEKRQAGATRPNDSSSYGFSWCIQLQCSQLLFHSNDYLWLRHCWILWDTNCSGSTACSWRRAWPVPARSETLQPRHLHNLPLF